MTDADHNDVVTGHVLCCNKGLRCSRSLHAQVGVLSNELVVRGLTGAGVDTLNQVANEATVVSLVWLDVSTIQ